MLLIEHRINTASIYNLLWKVSYRYLWDNMLIMTKKLSITKNFPLKALPSSPINFTLMSVFAMVFSFSVVGALPPPCLRSVVQADALEVVVAFADFRVVCLDRLAVVGSLLFLFFAGHANHLGVEH